MPTLDEKTKELVDEIHFTGDAPFGIVHELLIYGVDMVVHDHLMKKALKEVVPGIITSNEFCEKYGIVPSEWHGTPAVPKLFLQKEGIYVNPSIGDKIVELFSSDYLNYTLHGDKEIHSAFEKFTSEFHAKKKDAFKDEALVKDGIKFSEIIWNVCVENFKEDKKNTLQEDVKCPSPYSGYNEDGMLPKWIDLGNKLIEYYESVMKEF